MVSNFFGMILCHFHLNFVQIQNRNAEDIAYMLLLLSLVGMILLDCCQSGQDLEDAVSANFYYLKQNYKKLTKKLFFIRSEKPNVRRNESTNSKENYSIYLWNLYMPCGGRPSNKCWLSFLFQFKAKTNIDFMETSPYIKLTRLNDFGELLPYNWMTESSNSSINFLVLVRWFFNKFDKSEMVWMEWTK